VRRGQVEEYDQLEYRVIDGPRAAGVVWVENSIVQEHDGKGPISYFERTDGRCRVMMCRGAIVVMMSEERVIRLD